MSKEKVKVRINIGQSEDVETRRKLAENIMDLIPKVGSSIYVVQPFPADENDEAAAEDSREKPIMQYGYDNVFVKGTVLNDELDEVTVNGDYRLPLFERNTNKKVMVFTDEVKAIDTWRTLMLASMEVVDRKLDKYQHIKDNLKEALKEELH